MQRKVMIISDNLLKLKEIIALQSLPADDYKHHMFLSPKTMRQGSSSLKFDQLVTLFVSQSNTKRRGPQQLDDFKWHWEVVLMSLAQSIFQRRWLLVTMDNNAYGSKGHHLIKAFGFQLTYLKDIVRYLDEVGLVYLEQGKKYKHEPSKTRLFPKDELVTQIWEYFLDIEQDIKPPYSCYYCYT